ncbi:hypothetical protein [Kutzneria kofuensis]|uniref:hypothetical protein n=1 Tax=Kutzneria kofuensis TaxID=103725 RepID=UPI0031EF89AD
MTEPVGDGRMTTRVAYAEPPATVPGTVSHRRQRDHGLRSLSQPDRLGEVAGEPSLQAWKAAMTARRNFKRQVRARAAKTGESYTSALRHFRPTPSGEVMPEANTLKSVRLAVAQTPAREDPRDVDALRESGRQSGH